MPITKSLGIIFLVVFIFSVLLFILISDTVMDRTIGDIAIKEETHTSKLIFQSLYSVMRRGWSQQDIVQIVGSIQETIPDIRVNLYRSDAVVEQYGVAPTEFHPQQSDSLIEQVFASGRSQLVVENDQLRFVYPIIAEAVCLGCHVTVEVGDRLGLIEIYQSTAKLRVPLEYAVLNIIYIFLSAAILLGISLFVAVHIFLVKPVKQLAREINTLSESHDISRRLPAMKTAFYEIKWLRKQFNLLLGRVELSLRELRDRSERDPLTGLYNRRKFDELALQELHRSQHHQHSFALLMVDLNRFKPINDTYGHEAGDELLCAVASAMSHALRMEEVISRIGGDEFLILVPECGTEEATALSDKLSACIEQMAVKYKGDHLSVGCSLGVAIYPHDGLTMAELIRKADQRMYRNKRDR
ncbi:GGDEF domain-containing protein [Ectothiorhodospiraceae bacterium BW-2]|nr:GGDEF domain-containing protein [Ectothiorhodospiraceae bacterium BW-2]